MAFAKYVTDLKKLMLLDSSGMKAWNCNPMDVIRIRNELSNDGIIYTKHIKPIFQETLSEAVSFFESWND